MSTDFNEEVRLEYNPCDEDELELSDCIHVHCGEEE